MTFRRTENVKTEKFHFYVDGKRTSASDFLYKEALCHMKRMSLNCLHTEYKGDLIIVTYSYN